MKNLYVHELFALLHTLGTTQQVMAEHLGVARATVASWAAGQRPVPQRHVAPFLDYAATVIERAWADAWAQNRVPERQSLLGPPSLAEVFDRDILAALERWALERHETMGTLAKDYERHAKTLAPLLHLNPGKLNAEEREQVKVSALGMVRDLRMLAHLHNRSEETAGRILTGPSRIDRWPLERFWEIASWGRGGHETEESAETEQDTDT